MKHLFLSGFFLFLVFHIQAQKGKLFPQIKGETLGNDRIELPASTKGKYTLVGVAYSKKAQKALNTWSTPVYQEFIDETGMAAMVYDVHVYLVMLFTGANQLGYESAKKKIREGTDKELYKHTLLYKGELKKYKESLGLLDKDTPTFYVLDQEGIVIHTTHGSYTSKKLEKIGNLVEN